MSLSSIFSFGPMALVGAAFSQPLFSLLLALLIAGGVSVIASRPRRAHHGVAPLPGPIARSVQARYLPELRGLGIAAIAVIIVFAVENVVRGYLLPMPYDVAWWRYATPVFCALAGVSVVLGMVSIRGTTPSEVAVVPTGRRSWTSFSPRAGLFGGCMVLLALAATTIAAGLASSADDQGRYVSLEIPVPNEPAIDPIRQWFYGWAFGIPVLICVAALSVTTWALLHTSAARPFIRPETVTAEWGARREVASGAARVASAGLLLAMAGAWRLIARAGSGSQLTIVGQNEGNPYDASWRYAELATAAGWCAPLLEITAFILLLLVASRICRPRALRPPFDRAAHNADATATP
ncbi:hypothetical protein [Microbacterium aurantiacum]|uniref:hypothetical protein n=1 Tax=Microbacterium aurantiacum TaxID=162393 RepID=UPI000C807AA9|nr:hypothetical protein [Microbacterium aurantiacum]